MSVKKRVKWIENSNSAFSRDQIYTVTGESSDNYFIEEAQGSGWLKKRFQEVDPSFPTHVKCIDNDAATTSLTISKIYQVVGESSGKNDWKVIDNSGKAVHWRKSRFLLVQQEAPVSSPPVTLKSGQDPEEEKVWAFFRKSRHDECRCGAPKPCSYHG